MPNHNYLGLQLADLDHPLTLGITGRQDVPEVGRLKQVEARIWLVPRFSKLVTRHLRERLVKPRRQLVTSEIANHFETPAININVTDLYPLSMYVSLMDFLNAILSDELQYGDFVPIQAFHRYIKHLVDNFNASPSHVHFPARRCPALGTYVDNVYSALNDIQIKRGVKSANFAASNIEGTFGFRPYWSTANQTGGGIVLTDQAFVLADFFFMLNSQSEAYRLGYRKKHASVLTVDDCLKTLQKECPDAMAKDWPLAKRQLQYTIRHCHVR